MTPLRHPRPHKVSGRADRRWYGLQFKLAPMSSEADSLGHSLQEVALRQVDAAGDR